MPNRKQLISAAKSPDESHIEHNIQEAISLDAHIAADSLHTYIREKITRCTGG